MWPIMPQKAQRPTEKGMPGLILVCQRPPDQSSPSHFVSAPSGVVDSRWARASTWIDSVANELTIALPCRVCMIKRQVLPKAAVLCLVA